MTKQQPIAANQGLGTKGRNKQDKIIMVAIERPHHLLLTKIKANSKVKAGIEATVASNLVGIESLDKEATVGEKIRE